MEDEAPTPKLAPPPAGEWTLDDIPDEVVEEEVQQPAPAGRSPASTPRSALRAPRSEEFVPSPGQLVEAMLFAGGPPLTPAAFAAAVRVPDDIFRQTVADLERKYRAQNRPYTVRQQADGFVLAVLPKHRGLRTALFGGPKEARLTQPAVDTLAVVAYRQPATKAEIDAVRGADSGGVLRQLVRLGLIAVGRRGDGESGVAYVTTPRFLTVFGLSSLDDLPRLGDTHPV
jgi:segregation and condensation protein B